MLLPDYPSVHHWLYSSSQHSSGILLELLLLNAIVSAVLAAIMMPLRPAHLRSRWRRDYAVLLLTGVMIPLAGPLLIVFFMLLFRRFSHAHGALEAEQLTLSPFVPEDPKPLVHFGIGGAVHGLQAGALNTDKSIRALMAIEQQRSARTSKVLFDTLSHPDESVRLTAAGLLDRRESRVLQMIARVEKALGTEESNDSKRLAYLHLQAAFLNAEMLYLRLVREGMAALYLVRWGDHLDRAEACYGDSPGWLLSKGRWLRQGRLPGSEALYQRALTAGAAPSRVVPYLAEAYWEKRDYAGLRALVGTSDLFAHIPVSGVIKRAWGQGA